MAAWETTNYIKILREQTKVGKEFSNERQRLWIEIMHNAEATERMRNAFNNQMSMFKLLFGEDATDA